MSIIVERFDKIKSNIEKVPGVTPRTIVAVSKTFSLDHIMPLINHGHVHYGENKVQEAEAKLEPILKQIMEEQDIDLVLHPQSAVTFKPSVDITKIVTERLNKAK